ncbi:interleukin-10 receptor subunit alpha [Limanda limanda]|uniref:interleukin-10 receptor subunit alpha n=1 Tax=Limanda limanda TaxID=27771 RepID=UPI0029C8E28E|nr:interleukin-10 receptor subunit alpha [Limanda limanda]XP_060929365.1 interleukin-10 receptor subunit alpha [Limanda limanda]
MMIFLWTTKMDMSCKSLILLFLVICMNSLSVAGLDVPLPDDLMVNISDGEVLIYWKRPADAPLNSKYNVQMRTSNGNWTEVQSCTGITNCYCDLSSLIYDYNAMYRVKVQLVAGDDTSRWTAVKRVRLFESELQPPSFTLLATSSTLSVKVHQKLILRKLFSYGLTYTIYLEETEQDKITIAYLRDDDLDGMEQKTTTFDSLHWGKMYCVSIKVEGIGARSVSDVSPKQCLLLPEREWYIIAVSSLSILGVLLIVIVIATIVLCYVKLPGKTPAALKSPESYWLPLAVEEGAVEVVTDRGWFLSSYGTEVKTDIYHLETHIAMTEDNEKEEDRRTSGESNSATSNGGSPLTRQDDSGCGSWGGTESSTGSQTDYSLQDERSDADKVRKREDSGVGLGCQLDSSSVELDGPDIRPLKESVPVGSYRTQSPPAVHTCVSDDEEAFKQILPDTVLAEVVTGYRAGPQACICSGAGQCTWCHKQGHNGAEVIKQYRSTCIENVPLSSKCDFVDSYKAGLTFSSYSQKSQMDTVMMDDLKNMFKQLGDTFPLLSTLPPLVEGGHDFNMNSVCLSLNDVQLTTD